jgi:hypothetical protein
VAGTACALAVGAPVAAMTTVATDGAQTIFYCGMRRNPQ